MLIGPQPSVYLWAEKLFERPVTKDGVGSIAGQHSARLSVTRPHRVWTRAVLGGARRRACTCTSSEAKRNTTTSLYFWLCLAGRAWTTWSKRVRSVLFALFAYTPHAARTNQD